MGAARGTAAGRCRAVRATVAALHPLLVGHALGLQPGNLGTLRRVLLGVEDLPRVVEHGFDHADHIEHVGRVVAIECRDHLDGERHERRREPQGGALVAALHQRAHTHAGAAPVRVALAGRHTRRFEAAVHGDGAALVLTATQRCFVVGGQQALQCGGAVGAAEHGGHHVGGHPEARGEGLGLAVDETVHRRLVVVHEPLGRLGLHRLLAGLRVVTSP
jgi:hypothetical protein